MVGEQCLAVRPGVCVSLRQGDSGMSSDPQLRPQSYMAFGCESSQCLPVPGSVPTAKCAAKMSGGAWWGQRGTPRFAV